MKQQKTNRNTPDVANQQKAASQLKTQTFIDKSKGIVLRIVRNELISKIYVFPLHTILQNKATITIQPSGLKYVIPNINLSLVVKNLPEVKGVSVEVG